MRVHLQSRRGAFVILTAILLVSMMAMVALSVDFSRIGALRNELQVSADAGALGGAIQLLPNPAYGGAPSPPCVAGCAAFDSARSYATRNKAMQGTVTLDSVTFGRWDDIARTFTAAATPYNAVSTVVSRQTTGLTMTGLFGVTAPRIKARATAYAAVPVVNSGCIKPWAIPYPQLMSRINTYIGMANPNSQANLTRAFTPADLTTLMSMPAAQRQFDLHLGSGQNLDSLGTVAGNYEAVMPNQKKYDVQTRTWISNPQPAGGNKPFDYQQNVSGGVCNGVNIGDSLVTYQGIPNANNNIAPLVPNVCTTLKGYTDNTSKNSAAYGDCLNASGVAPTIVAMYFLCVSSCSGKSTVGIKLIGAFTLDKVFPGKANGANPAFDLAEMRGTFSALSGSGKKSSGGVGSPIVTVALVR